jgi:hypothetical protein
VLDDKGLVGAPAAVVDGARQHFLAGTRLAADQDREVERGDLLDQVADGIERATGCADQSVEGELASGALVLCFDAPGEDRLGGAQFERQALVLLLQAMDAGCGLQRQQQLLGLPGLHQVLVDAGLVDPGDDVLGVGVAGQDDAQGIRPLTAHGLEKLDAAHPRHALVADDDLHPLAFHDPLRLLGTRRGEHFEVVFERPPQGFLRAHFVIDDEHRRQLRFREGRSSRHAPAEIAMNRQVTRRPRGRRLVHKMVAGDVVARIEAVEVALQLGEFRGAIARPAA